MPSVHELTELYENFLLAPERGPDVCETCLTFTEGFAHCYACATCQPWLDAFAPISYSVASEQLHHALASYKRMGGEVAQRLRRELTALLWRFLDGHERCVAGALGISGFEVVTTVPSSRDRNAARCPLAQIVGQLCEPTRERYDRLLERSGVESAEHDFHAGKYRALHRLGGEAVLLIDDTWTTGSSAQSAAAAVKRAGSGPVAAVVIGRHLKRDWRDNDTRLTRLARPFDWDRCVYCAPVAASARTSAG
jgi:predicted amidophosphoribosyltransferase